MFNIPESNLTLSHTLKDDFNFMSLLADGLRITETSDTSSTCILLQQHHQQQLCQQQ